MLRSFTVKNYRCFRDFTIGGLERVNLIAGKNNTGKTALLEALFLFSGPNNPSLPTLVNIVRGVPQADQDAADFWGWLFAGKQIDHPIELTGEDASGGWRKLALRLEMPAAARIVGAANEDGLSLGAQASSSTAGLPRELVLDYKDSLGGEGVSRSSFPTQPNGQIQIADIGPRLTVNFIFTRTRKSVQADATRFSNLEEVGRQEEATAAIRILEPRLKRLAVLVSGGQPIIHGDLGMGRMIPVPYMGEGIGRLLSILLAIANARGGVALIDEIENGLHYSVQKQVWQAIAHAARQNDVQVFATTHSYECINAAYEAFASSEPYDFALHRLDRIDGEIKVVRYDRDMMKYALEMFHEVR